MEKSTNLEKCVKNITDDGYTFAPEKIEIKESMLYDSLMDIVNENDILVGGVEKLVPK